MKRIDAIVAAAGALWLLGAVASFWRASEASYVIAWALAAGAVALLIASIVRKMAR